MGQKITVRNRETLFDIAINTAGTIEAVFELAGLNGVSITAELHAGYVLLIPDYETKDRETGDYYQKYNIRPATGGGMATLNGIGYSSIGQTLVVG